MEWKLTFFFLDDSIAIKIVNRIFSKNGRDGEKQKEMKNYIVFESTPLSVACLSCTSI